MSPRIPWHFLRWFLLTLAGGAFYDAFKFSFVSSGFELLLPDLVFLIKPLLVVVGISLGGTVLSISLVDLWRAWRKRVKEARNRRRCYILTRLDFLIGWHGNRPMASVRHRAEKSHDKVKASDYADDLSVCGLIRPDLCETVKSWGSDEATHYLASVRSKFKLRGLEPTQEFVRQWQTYDAHKAQLNIGVD